MKEKKLPIIWFEGVRSPVFFWQGLLLVIRPEIAVARDP
jgi:hypothetical protein